MPGLQKQKTVDYSHPGFAKIEEVGFANGLLPATCPGNRSSAALDLFHLPDLLRRKTGYALGIVVVFQRCYNFTSPAKASEVTKKHA